MATIGNVHDTLSGVNALAELLGADKSFVEERRRRVRELGDVICKEAGVERGTQAQNLPRETVLGAESEQHYVELCEWLSTQSEHLAHLKPAVA